MKKKFETNPITITTRIILAGITSVLLLSPILSCGEKTLTSDSAKQPESKPVSTEAVIAEEDKLVVVWTSGDREVAINMAMMYTLNSARFGWWDDITFVVWGPSAKLLSEDEELQKSIQKMLELGITVKACEICADNYGVSAQLREMGITVKRMSELTNFLKDGRKVITF